MSQKTVMVAALNWGIGHATRDMPIINRLIKKGCRVILASDGAALNVWRREYPELETVELPSWNIKYQKWGSFTLKMASRAPYIIKAIREERKIIAEAIKKYQIDGLISDNRFGAYSPDIPTVFITHQISLRLTPLLRWAEGILFYYNNYFIKNFDTVWVPDYDGSPNLTGELSHRHKLKNEVRFLGPISRFMDLWDGKFPAPEYDVSVVLSGVEPQRTMLEEKLTEQLKALPNTKVILVQGRSDKNETTEIRPGFTVKSYMASEELMETFLKSKYIICRSGYSTILDLAVMKQTALMIPTPGQTEQVYLAEWLGKQGLVVCQDQRKLDVQAGIEKLKTTKGFSLTSDSSVLNNAIDDFLGKC